MRKMSPTRMYLLVLVVAAACGARVALHPPPVPVLLLHDVNRVRAGHDFWTLHPDRFRELADLFDRLGFTGIRQDEARAHLAGRLPRARAREAVLITVDDGFASSATLVGPELARRRHAATFFVVAGWGPPAHLSHQDMRALMAAGHDIGSHSMSHASLDVKPGTDPRREEPRITSELTDSRTRLAVNLGADIVSFAYPKGEWDATTKRLARSAGYAMAFTTDTGYLKPGDDPMELARFQLNWDTPLSWVEDYLVAPRRQRVQNLIGIASIACLAALGAAVTILNRHRPAPSCHTEKAPPDVPREESP